MGYFLFYWQSFRHKCWVGWFLTKFALVFLWRAIVHDLSKYKKDERSGFIKSAVVLRNYEYGSKEYFESLKANKTCIELHFKRNSHHPEHYGDYTGMDLYDLVEMYCDWYGASKRTKNGSMRQSLDVSTKKFKMSKDIVKIFNNTYQ